MGWVLEIEFDSLEIQQGRDPELRFPHDECTQILSSIVKHTDATPVDLCDPDFIIFNETSIKLMFDNLWSGLDDIYSCIFMKTRPKNVNLTRED